MIQKKKQKFIYQYQQQVEHENRNYKRLLPNLIVQHRKHFSYYDLHKLEHKLYTLLLHSNEENNFFQLIFPTKTK